MDKALCAKIKEYYPKEFQERKDELEFGIDFRMDKDFVYIEFTIGNFYKGLDKHVTEQDEEGVWFLGRLRTHKFTVFARLADKANQLVFN